MARGGGEMKIIKVTSCEYCQYFLRIKKPPILPRMKIDEIPLGFVCIHPALKKYRDLGDIIVNGNFPDFCPLESWEWEK